ncbi:hypothetical protein EAO24_08750 [Klebsiella pneumoniae]|nr:hypothetical protein EAO24_08750 [Klebsiella pneumoniae]RRE54883.1 hypothetical protein EAO06_09235 [Klebsiella pneumoniae]
MNKIVRDCTNLSLRNCLIADGYLGSNTFGIFYNDIVVKDNKENKQHGQISADFEIYLAGSPRDCSSGSAFRV